ncbi:penicillin acylase family protein [Pendulispora albinea]|uniref:Penicillin acylase family protein n=1 Tax=Pendulispora albinea TaxID=2741071 RepID=A0ABZ2M6F0_9BACT
MTRARTRRRRLVLWGAAAVAGLGLAAVGFAALVLRGSLPELSAEVTVAGLAGTVTVTSDEHAIPTVRAGSREDALRALGYLHARDRLFQMDLLRRQAAGRLAEIFGRDLLASDVQSRTYGFDRLAPRVVARLPAPQRAALEAYAEGVNGYLARGRTLPFEFQLLRYRPEAWRPEDSALVALGMFQVLSGSEDQERTHSVIARCVPPNVADFLSPDADRYTRALLGAQTELPSPSLPSSPPLPERELRALAMAAPAAGAKDGPVLAAAAGEAPKGSNGWVVAGSRTNDGRAILANDMHLDLGVPNVWYRATLRYGDVEITGVMLPGVPPVIAGSNGHVAWGVTNLEGDVFDLVQLEVDPRHPDAYRTPEGWKPFEVEQAVVKVAGEADVTTPVRRTIWGPVASRPLLGRPVAVKWTALDPEAVDFGLLELDRARTIDEATAILNRSGSPPMNALLADAQGRVGWTLVGRIPLRQGFDGAVSVSWAGGGGAWGGYLPPGSMPRLLDPPSGFVVNANQRMRTEPDVPVLGHDFGNGYRAYRITERLRAMPKVTERDLFALQLDTRSELFDVYRDLALATLDAATGAANPRLGEARAALSAWDGRAEIASPGFAWLVRFRRVLARDIFGAWLGACRALEPDFEFALGDIDTPIQRLLTERPASLVPPPATSWNDFVHAALLKAEDEMKERYGKNPRSLSWGEANLAEVRHPLSDGLPLVGRWLDMPAEPLAGCGFCVRMAAGTLGASERLVVSPGHEPDALFHMPAGQSGHPLSPHYGDQQAAWVAGHPLPLLAGPTLATSTLAPTQGKPR